MNSKKWLYVSLASIALIGCAPTAMQQNLTQQECTSSVCTIEVAMTGCNISVPDTLNVRRPHGAKKIEWEIRRSDTDYIFAANAIVIKQANPPGVLKRPHLSQNGKRFRLDNDHQGPGNFKYEINVVKTGDDPQFCTKDPFIVNE
jgi:hypothetical protein